MKTDLCFLLLSKKACYFYKLLPSFFVSTDEYISQSFVFNIPKSRAHVLHAIAAGDDERQPEAKTILREAYKKAGTQFGIRAEIEVYKGTQHGWCPPDSKVYNEAQAEKKRGGECWFCLTGLWGRV